MHTTRLFADELGTCLLYSGGFQDAAKKSILFLFPYEQIWIKNPENAWESLREKISFSGKETPEWSGYFGYGMGACSDAEKVIPMPSSHFPLAYWQRCAVTLEVDHDTEEGTLSIAEDCLHALPSHQQDLVKKMSSEAFWHHLNNQFLPREKVGPYFPIAESDTLDSYSLKIDKIKKLIYSGDVYQVNLSQHFKLKGKGHPFEIFLEIAELNPAPFSAFFQLGDQGAIISSSPERLLKKSHSLLETRPIKGTISRGKTPSEDAENKKELLCSEKDRAELLMITDLMRNDLGRISLPGSVQTLEFGRCEAYHNVFHLVSIIQSQALPHLHPLEIVRSCFPGGSITGCPKLKAMEIISDIENRSREIYTGSLGYFTGLGDFDFNIAIRTLKWVEGVVDIQLGGAIIADSDPIKEFEETLHKGASIFHILKK